MTRPLDRRAQGHPHHHPHQRRHRALIEADAACQLPTWWWFAAPAVFAGVIAVSVLWPWGFAS